MSPNDTDSLSPSKKHQNLPLNARVFVAGHGGMVGCAILRYLQSSGYSNIVTRTRAELDLTSQRAVGEFFKDERPDAVILAAAKVGGIFANNAYPAEFIYQNLMIQNNVIHAAYQAGVERLLFLGSSCIYPKFAPQPLREEYLLTGHLESTNEPYAVAKIAGIKMCDSYNRQYSMHYRSVMPTNLYGPGDNFDLQNSHVLPALIRKFHQARLAVEGDWDGIRKDQERFGPIPDDVLASLKALSPDAAAEATAVPPAVRLWGSGSARRELLHVDDMAAACIFVMNLSDDQYYAALNSAAANQGSDGKGYEAPSFFNIGCGHDLTIKELAELVISAIGYHGEIFWDRSKPEGTPQKLLDVSRLERLGWSPKISLQDGIRQTYEWYQEQVA
jgi:GDP-L-fucose synthase